ncbi:MAG: MerR family transcriptional regulator [Bacteroidetes bacterium]|nr:MerR family transcriptional regulator [Bacteroidota bacterium]
MQVLTISQLEQFSGIKAHTIRIWEQRYDALQPKRSSGNTRYYDSSQLRRLLNIVSLMGSNYKVSILCAMTDDQLFNILKEQLKRNTPNDESSEYYVSQLIAASMSFDEAYLEKIFSHCILRLGMRDAYTKVIYKLLDRIGLMWANDTISPIYEHFISKFFIQKLFSAVDSLPPASSSNDCWLLFLPEDEFHEIGLLFSNYLIRQAGKKVIYLGTNIPFEALSIAAKETAPSHLLFFLVHNNKLENSQQYLDNLKKEFNNTAIHLSGNKKLISQLKTGKDIIWLHSADELEQQLL